MRARKKIPGTREVSSVLLLVGTFLVATDLPAKDIWESPVNSEAESVSDATQPIGEKIGEAMYRIGQAVVDREANTVTVKGHFNMERGVIELLACGPLGKTHESVLVLEVEPVHLQTALLLLGLEKGKGVEYQGDPSSPQGDSVEVWVEWEREGKKHHHRGEDLVLNLAKNQSMQHTHWVFVGSQIFDGVFAAEIDQSYITTYHDPFTIIDNPLATGGDDEVYAVNSELVPPRGTPVTVTIRSPEKIPGRIEESPPIIRSTTHE